MASFLDIHSQRVPLFPPLFSKITSRFNIGQYNTSNSRLHKGVTVKSQESLLSTVNNTDEARDMLAKRILNPVQRRRTRSVGLLEENGVYWVYWCPRRGQGRDLQANKEKEDLWPEVLEKQQMHEVKKFMNFSRTPVSHSQ